MPPSIGSFANALPIAGNALALGTAARTSAGNRSFGDSFSQLAGGLRDVTRNLAGGFAKDPQVRANYQQMNAGIDQQREQQKAQERARMIESTVAQFETYAAIIQASGGKVPASIDALMSTAGSQLVQFGMPEDQVQSLIETTMMQGSIPPGAADADYQNIIGPDGTPLGMFNVADPNVIASLPQGASIGGSTPQLPGQAVQNYEFQKSSLSAPRINTTIKNPGTVPPDYQAVYDNNNNLLRYDVIPGSETDVARNKAAGQAATTADIVTQDIDQALEIIDTAEIPVTGVFSAAGQIPGTPANTLQNLLLGIKANIGFDRLQQMRQASPTGGALGSITEKEIQRLESVYGSLEQSQTADQLVRNLTRLRRTYGEIVHGKKTKSDTGSGTLKAPELPSGFNWE